MNTRKGRGDRLAPAAAVRPDTRALLISAAMAEFNEHGYGRTDSNKIARRAGFAPQTFYRWFEDKTAIFLAAYRLWQEEEMTAIAAQLGKKSATRKIVTAILSHHRAHRGFRRSLRLLADEEAVVRDARLESRKRQIARIRTAAGTGAPSEAEAALLLIQIERLSDAVAEDEITGLGVDERTAEAALAQLIRHLQLDA